MPLSEDEQRILRQIEEQLQRDPSFRREIRPRGLGSRRTAIVAVTATVLALGLAILLLSVSPYLSFVVFVAAVVCAVIAERHLRALGEAGLASMSDTMRSRMGGQGQRGDR